jgi:hypothetical protein
MEDINDQLADLTINNPDHLALIAKYDTLTPEQRVTVLGFIDGILSQAPVAQEFTPTAAPPAHLVEPTVVQAYLLPTHHFTVTVNKSS